MDFAGIADVVGGGLPDARVRKGSTALMMIDLQYADAHRDWGLGSAAARLGLEAETDYFFTRVETHVLPNTARLLQACRASKIPVIHVRVMNLVDDASDTSWRYKQIGMLVPPSSKEAEILEELEPLPGEIILSKTTSSVFVSTNADFLLRNMGIDTLIVTGVATNNCVESSTRTAGDLGYRVILVEDACAAWTEEGHRNAIAHLHRNFAMVRSTESVLEEIEAVTRGSNARGG